jgi:hypothetical protein
VEIEVDFGAVSSACRVSEAFGCLAIELSFYFTTLEKLIPGLSSEMKYLSLTNGHVIPVRDFMTLYIYKEIFVDRATACPLINPLPVIGDIGANSSVAFPAQSHEEQNGASA